MEMIASAFVGMVTLGGPLIWAMVLNVRDRRAAQLLNTVLAELSGPELRGRVAIRVQAGLLWAPGMVKVDLLGASRQEIWEILGRLSEPLSRRVRLDVTGPVERPLAATFTFERAHRDAPLAPAQRKAA
ncbi:MAG: hypothetical protein HYY64_12085 [Candidatus Rokubacteria bacterium]|nr:hypothetical protein [Candidatus Rokubacteria bacterium]